MRGRKLTELDPKLFAKGMAPAATLHKSEADRAKQEKVHGKGGGVGAGWAGRGAKLQGQW